MPSFSILHASDLHIAAVPNALGLVDFDFDEFLEHPSLFDFQSSHDDDMLEALAHRVYELRRGLDLVLLTGDLATTGARDDLFAAKSRLTAPAKRRYLTAGGKSTLGFMGKKLKLMPGNHDRFRRAPAFLPGGTAFDEIFAEHWNVGQSVQLLADMKKEGVRLAVLAADFTLAEDDFDTITRRFQHFGCGRVYDERLHELERRTRELRDQGAAVAWAVHFTPSSGDPNLALLEDELLMQAASDRGVSVVLCGHTHASKPLHEVGGVPVAVCGTTTQDHSPQGNFLHVLKIDLPSAGGAARLELERFRFDDLTGFVPVEPD